MFVTSNITRNIDRPSFPPYSSHTAADGHRGRLFSKSLITTASTTNIVVSIDITTIVVDDMLFVIDDAASAAGEDAGGQDIDLRGKFYKWDGLVP